MTSGGDNGPTDIGWGDPQPADQQHPESAFPGAGERVDDAKVEQARAAEMGAPAASEDSQDTEDTDDTEDTRG